MIHEYPHTHTHTNTHTYTHIYNNTHIHTYIHIIYVIYSGPQLAWGFVIVGTCAKSTIDIQFAKERLPYKNITHKLTFKI